MDTEQVTSQIHTYLSGFDLLESFLERLLLSDILTPVHARHGLSIAGVSDRQDLYE